MVPGHPVVSGEEDDGPGVVGFVANSADCVGVVMTVGGDRP
jgi:hypothetical protein